MTDAPAIVVTRRYEFPADRVFDAWITPERASKFLFTTETSTMIKAEVDARVGGRFTFVDKRGEEEITHVGEYLEIDRPRRLVFTFGVPQYDPAMTTVAIDIRPDGQGCELTLTHTGMPQQWAEQTQGGWVMILGNLPKGLA